MKRVSKEKLKSAYRSSVKDGGFFSVFIYRKISIQFVRVFVVLGLSPNNVTLLAFSLSVLAFILFSQGIYELSLFALIPFNLARIFDSSDGQLAVYMDKRTELGAFLDPFLDRVSDILVFGGISYGFYLTSGRIQVLYFYILLISVCYMLALTDRAARKYESFTGVESLRKIDNLVPLKFIKYIRWDGGFSAVLVTGCVISNQIILLFLCFLIINIIALVLSIKGLLVRLMSA